MDDFKLVGQHIVKTMNLGVHGNLFGGDMLRWLDEIGAIFASNLIEEANGEQPRILTLKASEVLFKVPVKVNSFIQFYAKVKIIGTTSLTIIIKAINVHTKLEVTTCELVFINVDENNKKKPHNLK